MAFAGLCFVFLIAVVLFKIRDFFAGKKLQQQRNIDKEVFDKSLSDMIESLTAGNINEVSTNLRLKKGEICIDSIPVEQSELKVVKTNYANSGGKMTVGKGAFKYSFGGGSVRAVPQKELTVVNIGELVITNNRMIVNSATSVDSFDYEKIIKYELMTDGVMINVDNKKTPILFHIKSNSPEDMGKIIGAIYYCLNKKD